MPDLLLARRILAVAPNLIWVYDSQSGRCIFQNRPIEELLGHASPPDGNAKEWERYLHPEDAPGFAAHRERVGASGGNAVLFWQCRMRHADGEWRYFEFRDIPLSADDGTTSSLVVGHVTDVTEQKLSEERNAVVLSEMRHRARNFAGIIAAIGRQALPAGDDKTRLFFETLMGRVRALLDVGDIVLASGSHAADLALVAKKALLPFRDTGARISVAGPSIGLTEAKAGLIALALHELATNAVKHGALADSEGTVALLWRTDYRDGFEPVVQLEWKETCTRAIAPPTNEGFGTRLIRYVAPRKADGSVDLLFEPDGLRCRIAIVLS